jgi:signal transduction histidine kinase
MNARARAPLRLWLTLALGAIVIAPTLTTWGLSQSNAWWRQRADQAQWSVVRETLGTDVRRWHSPTWQRHAALVFAVQHVEVGLVDKQYGPLGLVFVTPAARSLMSAFVPVPAVTVRKGKTCATSGAGSFSPASCGEAKMTPVTGSSSSGTFREIPFFDPAGPANQTRAVGVADLWFSQPANSPPAWLPQIGGLIALLLTLAAVALFLRRALLSPLAAMSRAARQIAAGDLNVQFPASPAREVADVSTALETMGAGLREAVKRQADLAEERRLLVGAVAHDLRTPLFTLSGYLDGLKAGLATTAEKADRYVEVCREQTAVLERLVADLFAYISVDYLERAPNREALELGAVLRQAAEHLAPRAAAHAISLDLLGPEAPCSFTGDPRLFPRAIENLLDNAVRYTPAEGSILVRWRRANDTFVFTIEDSGPGIAPHDLPHLFTPLYRGEPSRNRLTGGTGLGLTIALRILQAHGGNLTAANRAAGGAMFTGILPAIQ